MAGAVRALVAVVVSMSRGDGYARRLDLLANPAVAALLEQLDQLGAALLDDPPVVHHVHEVGLHQMEDALVVGDDQDPHLGPGELADALGHGAQGVDVEAGVGLVEDGELGPQHRELEDLHSLLLAAREAVVQVAARELAGDVHQLHRRLGLLAEVLQLDLALAPDLALGVDRHPQVLGDRHAGDRDRVLEGHEQPGASAVLGRGLGDVLAPEPDLAVGHVQRRVAHDRVGQGRLAGAVRAHQRVDLARGHVEVDPLEDPLALGAHVQVAYLQVGHSSSLSWLAEAGPWAAQPATGSLTAFWSANSTKSASVVPESAFVIPP